MASSGTYNYTLSVGEGTIAAFERVGVRAPSIRQEHMSTARRERAIVYYALQRSTILDERPRMYVGVTGKSLGYRKARHLWDAKNGSKLYFHRALAKYGEDDFVWRTLDVQQCYRRGLVIERKIIADLRRHYDLFNMTDGGEGVSGLKFSDASRQKMSEAKKGKPSVWSLRSMPAHIRKILAASSASRKGQPISDEHRAALLLNVAKAVSARRRSVVCVTTGERFASTIDAANAYEVGRTSIARWCDGAQSRRGLKFRYEDDR